MKRVIKHIEQLLYKEECVVVPGLGAFIRHQKSATLDMSRGLIYPGRCDITFNAALSQSDGLLVQCYSEAFSFGYKRALALLESDVQELKGALAGYGVVQMGQLGKLMQDRTDGRITFIPNPDHPFSIDYYGLQPVAMLPKIPNYVAKEESDMNGGTKSHIYYLPINLRAIKYGAAAAVIAAMTLLVPSQVLTNPADGRVQYQAGFLTNHHEVAITNHKAEVEKTTPVIDFEGGVSAEVKDTEKPMEIVKIPVGRECYFVVIASLSNEVQYGKYVEEHSAELKALENAGVLISNTYHRVYAGSFDTHSEAKEYLNQLTENPEYSSAWIYKSK